MKLSETVQEVIRLGNASHLYWDRELRKRHPRYPIIRPGEDSGPPPPEDAKILELLRNLPEDQLYALTLLVYVGRGEFSADHLPSDYQIVKEMFPNKELAIAQMTGNYSIGEYLTDALEECQKRHIDLDDLNLMDTATVS